MVLKKGKVLGDWVFSRIEGRKGKVADIKVLKSFRQSRFRKRRGWSFSGVAL